MSEIAPLTLLGMRVVLSEFMPPPGGKPREVGFADWRERLARNLTGPSTRKWEPLTYLVPPPPDVLILPATTGSYFGDRSWRSEECIAMHPKMFAALRKVFSSPLSPP